MRKFSNLPLHTLIAGALLTAGAMAQTSTSSTQAPPAASGQTTTSQPGAAAATPTIPGLPTKKDQISYAIGMNIGKGLARESITVDPNVILQGIKDAMAGGKLLMTDDQAQQTLTQLQAEVREQEDAKRKQLSVDNAKAGDAFLAKNKTQPGVVTSLPSGLQYKMIRLKARARSRLSMMSSRVTTRARCSMARNSIAPTSAVNRQPSRSRALSKVGPKRCN